MQTNETNAERQRPNDQDIHEFCRDNPSAMVDYQDPKQIVDHLRALLDLHDLLERGYDAEVVPFLTKLRQVGWGPKQINEFTLQASYNTRYEALIEPPIPNRGDRIAFQNEEYRRR